jgi:hypothetical protein
MFGDRYFGARFYGNHYFGPVAPSGGGPGSGGDRHETSWGTAPSYLLRVLVLFLLT